MEEKFAKFAVLASIILPFAYYLFGGFLLDATDSGTKIVHLSSLQYVILLLLSVFYGLSLAQCVFKMIDMTREKRNKELSREKVFENTYDMNRNS